MQPLKDASFVDLSPSDTPVTNVLGVVEGIPVGAHLQIFWHSPIPKFLHQHLLWWL